MNIILYVNSRWFFYIFYNPFRKNTPIALFILRCKVKNYIQVRILYINKFIYLFMNHFIDYHIRFMAIKPRVHFWNSLVSIVDRFVLSHS